MKSLLIPILAMLVTACAGAQEPAAVTEINKLRGQWVVINYWAPWCKPCIEEIPELNALDQRFDDVTVMGVNYDGASGDELTGQIQRLGIEFTVLVEDPAAHLGVARPVVLPSTLIVDPAGEVVATLLGPQTLESLARATAHTL